MAGKQRLMLPPSTEGQHQTSYTQLASRIISVLWVGFTVVIVVAAALTVVIIMTVAIVTVIAFTVERIAAPLWTSVIVAARR